MRRAARVWWRSLLRAVIGGAAGGVVNAFGAIGIKPDVFNLSAGIGDTLKLAAVGAFFSAILAVAMYFQKSPLPEDPTPLRDTIPLPPAGDGQ